MRTRTVGILLIVLVVLVPTWYVAAQPIEHPSEVEIDTEQTDMRPLQSLVDTPQAFTPAQVGVVIWIVLGILMAILAVFHRFMERSVRPQDRSGAPSERSVPDWFRTEHRWIAEYVEAPRGPAGLYTMVALSIAAAALSVLVVIEFNTLARTQYFGLYVGSILLILAGATAAYYAWFLPHVRVAEERYHE